MTYQEVYMSEVIEKFLRYVAIDTESKEEQKAEAHIQFPAL